MHVMTPGPARTESGRSCHYHPLNDIGRKTPPNEVNDVRPMKAGLYDTGNDMIMTLTRDMTRVIRPPSYLN
jgi:hypothetical protein